MSDKEHFCPKCGSLMRAGFIVQKDVWDQLITWSGGVYWCPGELGFIGSRVALVAYACPECGYVETYIRYLSADKTTILKAPTSIPFREPEDKPYLGNSAWCINCKKYVPVNPSTEPVWMLKCPECGRSGLLSKNPDEKKISISFD